MTVPSEINKLVQSFWINRLNRFNMTHAIPLVILKGWIKAGTYEVTPNRGCRLPMLEIGSAVGVDWLVKAAGGQHQLEALRTWKEKKEKWLEVLQEEEERLSGQYVEDTHLVESEQMKTGIQCEMEALEVILRYGGQWMVSIFDSSECSDVYSIQCTFLANLHGMMLLIYYNILTRDP